MNENTIEKLMRKAPPIRTPDGLLEQLQRDIEVPRAAARTANHEPRTTNGFGFRRWIPALGFALWFLGCLVVFGIQASRFTELREQHRVLESAKVAAAQQALAAEASNTAAAAELERLKKDLADVERLRTEIEQLRAEMQELAALRGRNQQLREELRSPTAPPPKPEEDFFTAVQARATKIKCVSNLKQLGLAARIWAKESKSDVLPDRTTLRAYLPNAQFDEKILFCPESGVRGYEILSPDASESFPDTVYSRCPIHNNCGLTDGSVQMVNSKSVQIVQKDGRWVLNRIGE